MADEPQESLAAGLRCFRCHTFIAQDEVSRAHLVCACGGPLVQEYDVGAIADGGRDALRQRPWGVWRYRELLPVIDSSQICSLSEGGTPLSWLPKLASRLGVGRLGVKDEGRNPTGSFKARGASVAVSRLVELGVELLAMPTVGSGGSAWSAYAAKAGVDILVGLPTQDGIPAIAALESAAYGAEVTRFPGAMREAFVAAGEYARERNADVAGAFLEPYRLEGEKTIGYEIAEEMQWDPPDWIVWPAGGGVGFAGLGKAFRELRSLRWLDGALPGLVAVQIEGCSPLVDTIRGGGPEAIRPATRTESIAPGITVPHQAFGDLVMALVEDHELLAAAPSEQEILAQIRAAAAREGVLMSPEGAAGLAAVQRLRDEGAIEAGASVVVVNTATGLRYPHVLELLESARGTAMPMSSVQTP